MMRRKLQWRWGWIIPLVWTSSGWGATETIAPHAIYPEGPLWQHDRLLFVEYGGTGVEVWNGTGIATYWHSDHCGPSGLTEYKGTHLLVACYDTNSLVELDGHGATVRTIEHASDGKPFIGPNDFTTDAAGGVYFSASGVYDINAPITGTVMYLAPDGQLTEVANTLHYPNGLTLSKDGATLLVAEDLAARIVAFPVTSAGRLGPRTVWARLRDLAPPTKHEDAYNGPDGLKLGPDGNYYIAQNGSGRVLVVGADKKRVRIIRVPTPYVTNMAFGAANSLYITGVFDPWKAPFPGVVYRWTPTPVTGPPTRTPSLR